MKSRYIFGAFVAAALVTAFVYFYGGSQAPAGQAPLESLTSQNIADVKNGFNADQDHVRVLLLLSPT
jgi:hypothetical protein